MGLGGYMGLGVKRFLVVYNGKGMTPASKQLHQDSLDPLYKQATILFFFMSQKLCR